MPNWIPLTVYPKIPSSAIVEEVKVIPDPYEVFMQPKVLSPSGLEKDVLSTMESGMKIVLDDHPRENNDRHINRRIHIDIDEYIAPIWILAHFFSGDESARKNLDMPWTTTSSYLKREKDVAYICHPIHPPILTKAGITLTQENYRDYRLSVHYSNFFRQDPLQENYRLVIPVRDFPSERVPLHELKNHPQTVESVFLNDVDWFMNEFLERAKFVKNFRHQFPQNPYVECFFAWKDLDPPYGLYFEFGGNNYGNINFGIACCDYVHYNAYAKNEGLNRYFVRIIKFAHLLTKK